MLDQTQQPLILALARIAQLTLQGA